MRNLGRGLVLWVIPVGLFIAALGIPSLRAPLLGVPEITVTEMAQALAGSTPPVLVDVRGPAEYQDGHVPHALSVPLPNIDGFLASLRTSPGTTIVMICEHGVRSAAATLKAQALGHGQVVSLAGGTAAWRERGMPVVATEPLATHGLPPLAVAATRFEQLVATTTAFVVKPLYMLLALAAGIWLWRRRETDLVLLRSGFLIFFAGEAACALRFALPFGNDPLEMGHGIGMVVMGALFPWGLYQLVDQRVLGFSSPERTCVLQRLCQRCWKREAVRCGLHRVMRVAIPCLALLALLPLCQPIHPLTVRYQVFGSWVQDETTILIALAQGRLYPLMALWLFAVAWLALRKGRAGIERATLPFFAGFGLLAYALLRFLLQSTFGAAVFWSNAWEELTELAAIGLLVFALWAFRDQLGLGRAPAAEARQSEA